METQTRKNQCSKNNIEKILYEIPSRICKDNVTGAVNIDIPVPYQDKLY